MKILTALSGSNSTDNWSQPAQQTTILDFTNTQYLRNVILSNDGVLLVKSNIAVGIPIHDLFVLACSQEPTLTWPPIIGTQPVGLNVANNSAVNFSVVATSETDITQAYQWRITNLSNASNWDNLSDGGVYATTNTAMLNISNVSGLNGRGFDVLISNCGGVNQTISVSVTLLVQP